MRNPTEHLPARPDFTGWDHQRLLRLVAQTDGLTQRATRNRYRDRHALVQQAVAIWCHNRRATTV